MCLEKWCSSIQTFSFICRAQSFCCCCCCCFTIFLTPPPRLPPEQSFFFYPKFVYRGPPTIPPPPLPPPYPFHRVFFTPIFVQYSTVTLHNRFSGLDARALQSGLWRFCEFFRGGAGEEDTSVLVPLNIWDFFYTNTFYTLAKVRHACNIFSCFFSS